MRNANQSSFVVLVEWTCFSRLGVCPSHLWIDRARSRPHQSRVNSKQVAGVTDCPFGWW